MKSPGQKTSLRFRVEGLRPHGHDAMIGIITGAREGLMSRGPSLSGLGTTTIQITMLRILSPMICVLGPCKSNAHSIESLECLETWKTGIHLASDKYETHPRGVTRQTCELSREDNRIKTTYLLNRIIPDITALQCQ